ncbi:hypothetical protein OAG01_00240 [bacterium]|nr:hypothetical protein [bacterium]MDA7668741.1 hypothetical protein [bacterium]MDB4632854.1 hypothetical protein [bacterium]
MFVTMTITPQELERLARPEHVEDLRELLRDMDDRRESILPPNYRSQWIDLLRSVVAQLPQGDGVAPTPRLILRKLRDAGVVDLYTERWQDLEHPGDWWQEIEAGHQIHAHKVIVGSNEFPCPDSLRSARIVWSAREAGKEILRPVPKASVQGLSELLKVILPWIRIHPLVVFENRYIQPNRNPYEFPHVLDVILDSLANPDSYVEHISLCTVDLDGGGHMKSNLIERIKYEMGERGFQNALRSISIELRRYPTKESLPANRRIFLGRIDGRHDEDDSPRFEFMRGLAVDHPEGNDTPAHEDDPTTLTVLDDNALSGGNTRHGRSHKKLKRRGVEVDLITTADL